MRITDLARQLDFDVTALIMLARDLGFSATDADSALDSSQEWSLRKAAVEQSSPPDVVPVEPLRPFSPAGSRRPINPPQRARRRSPMAQAVRRAEDALRTTDYYSRSSFEPDYSEEIGRQWADELFEPREVEKWLVVHKMNIVPDVAAALRAVGVTAEQSALRLWYGKINKARPTLAARVAAHSMTPEEVVDELRAAGLLDRAS